jgi:aminoglycoside phosphotransferase (APT) family kinase protein
MARPSRRRHHGRGLGRLSRSPPARLGLSGEWPAGSREAVVVQIPCLPSRLFERLVVVPVRMHDDEVEVDDTLVHGLLATQMPDLADLSLVLVEPWGTDNAIWRLGADLVIRLPRIHWTAGQPQFEARWLPLLAQHLPITVPEPIAVGEPADGYPYRWAVQRWIVGEGAAVDRIEDPVEFALALADVLRALQSVPTADAPAATNRARPLASYDTATRWAIDRANHMIEAAAALEQEFLPPRS